MDTTSATTTETATTAETAPDYSSVSVPLPTDGNVTLAEIAAAINGLKTAEKSAGLTTAQTQALDRVTQFFGS